MAWTEEQDLLLCREILISQPYKFPLEAEKGAIPGVKWQIG